MFIVSLLGCLYTHLYSFALLTPTLVEVLNLNSIQVREMMSLTTSKWKTSRLNLKLISFSFSPYFINHYTYISSDDYTNLPPLSPNRHPLRRSSQPSPRRNTRLRLPRHQRGSPSFLQGRWCGTDVAFVSRANSEKFEDQNGSMVEFCGECVARADCGGDFWSECFECQVYCYCGFGGGAECLFFGKVYFCSLM